MDRQARLTEDEQKIMQDQTFSPKRIQAAQSFAQTLIVVDDEASQRSTTPITNLSTPSRNRPRVVDDHATDSESPVDLKHSLDARSLIEESMEIGLICSVFRPSKEIGFHNKVVQIARLADIVCLDWEIFEDQGSAASKIIGAIISQDSQEFGRLRLIAIYTGDTTNNVILDKVFSAIPKNLREKYKFTKDALKIESEYGVKIVCLFKSHGVRLPEPRNASQLSERELPKRLQSEYASLSKGLLSTVALATIASIRKSTHHVLSRFSQDMDGPYFHHRATIRNPPEAEEYAINLVLSELKTAIDKQAVGSVYAGEDAIKARVAELASGNAMKLKYQDQKVEEYELEQQFVSSAVADGLDAIGTKGLINPPSKKTLEKNFSSVFSSSYAENARSMRGFAVLSGVRASPLDHLYASGETSATLGLGSILKSSNGVYFLCLQAVCDAVRIKEKALFLFVPLRTDEASPEHVVPEMGTDKEVRYVGLRTSDESYRAVLSIEFASDPTMKKVIASKIRGKRGLFFRDTKRRNYQWIADLKQRRGLRTAQRLGQSMGRLGFDEFEPYRSRD